MPLLHHLACSIRHGSRSNPGVIKNVKMDPMLLNKSFEVGNVSQEISQLESRKNAAINILTQNKLPESVC